MIKGVLQVKLHSNNSQDTQSESSSNSTDGLDDLDNNFQADLKERSNTQLE